MLSEKIPFFVVCFRKILETGDLFLRSPLCSRFLTLWFKFSRLDETYRQLDVVWFVGFVWVRA
jgi:hypothetical protein